MNFLPESLNEYGEFEAPPPRAYSSGSIKGRRQVSYAPSFLPESLNEYGEFEAPPPRAYSSGSIKGRRQVSYAPSQCPTIASERSTSRFLPGSSYTSTPTTSLAENLSFKTKPGAAALVSFNQPPSSAEVDYALPWQPTNVVARPPKMKKFVHEVNYGPDVVHGSSTSHTPVVRGRPLANAPERVRCRSNNSPLRDATIVEKDDTHHLPTNEPPKRRSWRTIRHTVSNLLRPHPKLKVPNYVPPSSSCNFDSDIVIDISAPRALQPSRSSNNLREYPSSASLKSKYSHGYASNKRLTITPPGHVFDDHNALAKARKQKLRRSRSFSGHPTMMITSLAEEYVPEIALHVPLHVHNEELDIAEEAYELMHEIQKSWDFAPLPLDDPEMVAQGVYNKV